MRITIVLLALAGVALSPAQDDMDEVDPKPKACDLKKIEKAPYCESCWKIDPKTDEDGLCIDCETKPEPVKVCVKTYFSCSHCGARMAENKEHCDEAKIKKETLKSRVVFRCEECGEDGTKDGADCPHEECREAGKKIRRTCEESGDWPHGGKSPAK